MFGWGYVKDTCIALFNKEQEEKKYKKYIADAMQNISENISIIASAITGGNADVKYVGRTFDEMLNPQPIKEQKQGDAKNRIKAKLR